MVQEVMPFVAPLLAHNACIYSILYDQYQRIWSHMQTLLADTSSAESWCSSSYSKFHSHRLALYTHVSKVQSGVS